MRVIDKETELAIVRRAYAKQLTAFVGVSNSRIEAAFADVPRERFLGPGPLARAQRDRQLRANADR